MIEQGMEEEISIEKLKTYFKTKSDYVKAVDDLSMSVKKGQIMGLAGESGSGKSTVVTTIFRVLPSNAEVKGGKITFEGNDILSMDEKKFKKEIRWKKISWIPQVSMDSLDPLYTVKSQMMETILTHEDVSKAEAAERAYKALESVKLNPEIAEKYPHELSGGQKQRVIIAMALLLNPSLVIADEPTTALDVVTQASIVELLTKKKKEMGFSMIFVTHDLSLLATMADAVTVMYAGQLAESGNAETIFKSPEHPYTKLLLKSIPDIRKWKERKLYSIPGEPPNLENPPSGCRFRTRCPFAMEICKDKVPEPVTLKGGHVVACHLLGDRK